MTWRQTKHVISIKIRLARTLGWALSARDIGSAVQFCIRTKILPQIRISQPRPCVLLKIYHTVNCLRSFLSFGSFKSFGSFGPFGSFRSFRSVGSIWVYLGHSGYLGHHFQHCHTDGQTPSGSTKNLQVCFSDKHVHVSDVWRDLTVSPTISWNLAFIRCCAPFSENIESVIDAAMVWR